MFSSASWRRPRRVSPWTNLRIGMIWLEKRWIFGHKCTSRYLSQPPFFPPTWSRPGCCPTSARLTANLRPIEPITRQELGSSLCWRRGWLGRPGQKCLCLLLLIDAAAFASFRLRHVCLLVQGGAFRVASGKSDIFLWKIQKFAPLVLLFFHFFFGGELILTKQRGRYLFD